MAQFLDQLERQITLDGEESMADNDATISDGTDANNLNLDLCYTMKPCCRRSSTTNNYSNYK